MLGKYLQELFILGNINKGEEVEGLKEPESSGKIWATWLKLDKLPTNLQPQTLLPILLRDYRAGFPISGQYLGKC